MTKLTGAVCEPLMQWYRENARALPWRENKDPYRIWVSEIMLQQTRVEAVKGYYARFMAACPTVETLAAADEETYLKLWEGLGYYSRVRNLHKAAQMVMLEHGGKIPASYEGLLALPGIGDYTAGAVASIAFGERVPAVDGNVLRVVSRLTADMRPVSDAKVKKDMRQAVQAVMPEEAGTFNQALMELGATICIPNGAPKCSICPVLHLCEGAQTGVARTLPIKAPKKARRIEARTIFILECSGKFAICRRPEQGLLANLWELPGVPGALHAEEARAYLRAQGADAQTVLRLQPAKHIFTHVEWHMSGYFAALSALPQGGAFTFVSREELRERYTLPSAFKAFMKVIENGV